ncbi:MAG: Asp-tRNA(Asn)/Glu-tRNA(Gln) amidotransferase subunit GatA [Elusimicrobia bacterium]|nr:Asp-tRNA(Asn)/Glu-tRNA(Gln) amidotransferase subunit GatA [Elusimicrobiota bacterium]
MSDILELTASQVAAQVREGALKPGEVLDAYFARLDAVEPKVGAYLRPLKERAYERARALESKGRPSGRLAGVPVAVKDNMLLSGHPTTCASKILEGYVSTYTATAVERLESEGALVIGKTNLDEFAMGSSTENSAFKITKNPWDLSRVPGGSSGGSAASVAAGSALAALGSDTGGSIRQPAGFCGLVGFKPSYGFVSRFGLVAFASSLDQIGPMARNAEDATLIFESIAGHDPKDSTSFVESGAVSGGAAAHFSGDWPRSMTVGLPKEYFSGQGADHQVLTAVDQAVKTMAKNGVKVQEVSLPNTRFALSAYYILAPSEASANLARFDGIRYGKRVQSGDLIGLYKASRTQGFGPEVQRRILIGTFALSHGYYDAYYGQAQLARAMIAADFDAAFNQVDFVVAPTTPTPAFKIGEKTDDPVSMYLSDIFTIPVNLAGLPAVSLPCGFSADGLPIGFQILGPRAGDLAVLRLARCFEEWTGGSFCRRPVINAHGN